MKSKDDLFQINRQSWNRRVEAHFKSDFYDVEGFKAGKTSLNSVELEELGDVQGKSLLHLQCHFGQDTLSWAREGAIVTGVDLSDAAIDTAKSLADELKIAARFINANIYDIPQHIDEKFDIIFTSYGTICWLPDLDKWAGLIKQYLKPGGIFLIVEFHPFIQVWDYEKYDKIVFPYFFQEEPFEEVSKGTYTDGGEDVEIHDIEWGHSPSETLTALLNSGLRIQSFREYPFSSYNCFPGMVEIEKGKYVVERFGQLVPHMYSIKAVKE